MSSENRDDRQIKAREAEAWQRLFPYHWERDDLVSRRQVLRWTVWTSGALFAATGLLAGLGLVRDRRTEKAQRIIAANEVAPGDVHYFDYPDEDEMGILLNLEDDGFVAYSGKCTHLACAVYWEPESGELICPCHNGIFDPRTGEVLAGPPERPLPRIELREEEGVLYAVAQVSS